MYIYIMLTHKLILMINDKKKLTLASKTLMMNLKNKKLLSNVEWVTKEKPSYAYKNPYLSISKRNSVKILTKQEDIIDFFNH